jgi:hypothetical protein
MTAFLYKAVYGATKVHYEIQILRTPCHVEVPSIERRSALERGLVLARSLSRLLSAMSRDSGSGGACLSVLLLRRQPYIDLRMVERSGREGSRR